MRYSYGHRRPAAIASRSPNSGGEVFAEVLPKCPISVPKTLRRGTKAELCGGLERQQLPKSRTTHTVNFVRGEKKMVSLDVEKRVRGGGLNRRDR